MSFSESKSNKNSIFSIDANFFSNSKNFNSQKFCPTLCNLVANSNHFSSCDILDKSLKNNNISLELFVKHKDNKYLIENMLDNISEKMKSR